MAGITVTSIDRMIDIFEVFQRHQTPLSLTDLAEAINIPKSTCHAIVSTLAARGYLYTLSRPRALYPTRRMFDVMTDICVKDPLVERATPVLERLRRYARNHYFGQASRRYRHLPSGGGEHAFHPLLRKTWRYQAVALELDR